MPALSQASSCAKGCVNTQPFAWMWSNYKCFNLQPAQRPGALWRHRHLLWPEMPHVLVPWTWGALFDTLLSCSESCLHVSRQLNCCSLTICQCWRALSTTVRRGYMSIFCTLAANGLFLLHPKTLCIKMGRNHFSNSNLSIALAKWAATHLSLKIGITSMLASIVWFFCPQIKIRVELLQI